MSVEYEPGQCNIGPGEQRRRLRFGALGFLGTAIWVVIVVIVQLPAWAMIAAAGPLFAGILGLLQARERFCIGYALRGVFDGGEGTEPVGTDTARESDRQAAIRLAARSAAYAVAGALALFLVGRYVS